MKRISILVFSLILGLSYGASAKSIEEVLGDDKETYNQILKVLAASKERCPSFEYDLSDWRNWDSIFADIKECTRNPEAFEAKHKKSDEEGAEGDDAEYKKCIKDIGYSFSSARGGMGRPLYLIQEGWYYVLYRGNDGDMVKAFLERDFPDNQVLKSVCEGVSKEKFSLDRGEVVSSIKEFLYNHSKYRCSYENDNPLCSGKQYISAVGPFSEKDGRFASAINAVDVIYVGSKDIPEKPDCGALCW